MNTQKSKASPTSQQCSACGYVDKKNRKDQSHFKCKCCVLSLNADVNAARNIRGRSPNVLPRGRGSAHRKTLYDVLGNHAPRFMWRMAGMSYDDRLIGPVSASVRMFVYFFGLIRLITKEVTMLRDTNGLHGYHT